VNGTCWRHPRWLANTKLGAKHRCHAIIEGGAAFVDNQGEDVATRGKRGVVTMRSESTRAKTMQVSRGE
jgi:hypothetical protein